MESFPFCPNPTPEISVKNVENANEESIEPAHTNKAYEPDLHLIKRHRVVVTTC